MVTSFNKTWSCSITFQHTWCQVFTTVKSGAYLEPSQISEMELFLWRLCPLICIKFLFFHQLFFLVLQKLLKCFLLDPHPTEGPIKSPFWKILSLVFLGNNLKWKLISWLIFHHQFHIWQNSGSRVMGQNAVSQSDCRIL